MKSIFRRSKSVAVVKKEVSKKEVSKNEINKMITHAWHQVK